MYLNYKEKQVKDAAAAIHSLSNKQRGNTQTALRFVLQQPAVSCAVVGIRTLEQLNEAVKTTCTPALSPGEITQLKNAVPANYYKEHR